MASAPARNIAQKIAPMSPFRSMERRLSALNLTKCEIKHDRFARNVKFQSNLWPWFG
jgi:hypothetical protein